MTTSKLDKFDKIDQKLDSVSAKLDETNEKLARTSERLGSHLHEEEARAAALDARFAGIDEKISQTNEILGDISITLAKQEISLSEHIRRTGLLEDALATEKLDRMAEIKPLLDRQIKLAGFFEYLKPFLKIGGILAAVAGGGVGMERLFELLSKAL